MKQKDGVKLEGKKDPKHTVVAQAVAPLDRAAQLRAIEAAKSVKELTNAVVTFLARLNT